MDWFKSLTAETPAETKPVEPAPAAGEDVGSMIGSFFQNVATATTQAANNLADATNAAVADVQKKIEENKAASEAAAAEEAKKKAEAPKEPEGPSVGEQIGGFFTGLKASIDEGIANALPAAEKQLSQREANAHIKHFGELPPTCKKPEVGKYEFQNLRDELFDDEWEVFQELKKEEISKHFTDRFLAACLFSRKLDIKRTVDMLKKNLEWRTQNNLLETPDFSTLPKDMMFHDFALKVPGARGLCGEGIIYVKMGNMKPADIPGFVDGCVLWTVWNGMHGGLFESMDYYRNGMIIVSDLSGMGWHNVDFELQRRMSDAMLDCFPMRVTKIVLLNPPWMITGFLNGLSIFIKKKVMDRIGVMENRENLVEFIGKDNLWTGFGGDLEYDMKTWFTFVEDVEKRAKEQPN